MIKALTAGIAALSVAACVSSGTATEPVRDSGYHRVPVAGDAATPEERAACEAAGGAIGPVGLLGNEQCIQTYPDAGQSCTDSSDCLGRCLNAGAWVEIGQTVTTGQCQQTDVGFGCFQVVTAGLAEPGLCVD